MYSKKLQMCDRICNLDVFSFHLNYCFSEFSVKNAFTKVTFYDTFCLQKQNGLFVFKKSGQNFCIQKNEILEMKTFQDRTSQNCKFKKAIKKFCTYAVSVICIQKKWKFRINLISKFFYTERLKNVCSRKSFRIFLW